MQYYQKIIDAAFEAVSESSSPAILSVLPNLEPSDLERRAGNHTGFHLPDELQPSGANIHQIPGGELFVENAAALVANTKPDCVFTFPPLVGYQRLSKDFRDHFGSLGISEATAKVLADKESVGEIKVCALLVPHQFLANVRTGAWRREFFSSRSAIIIEHGIDCFGGIFPSQPLVVPSCTVLFRQQPGPIRFFKLPAYDSSIDLQKIISDLRRLIRQPAGRTEYGYVHQGQLHERYPVSFDFYSEETKKLREEVSHLGERVQLQTVADVLTGYQPCQPERESGQGITGYLSIGCRDILRDGRVVLNDVREQTRAARVNHYLQEGDFCLRQVYSEGEGFVVGVFDEDGRQITWGPNVLVVRPLASLLPAQRQVLLSFLRSPLAQRLGSAKQMHSSIGRQLRVLPHVLREFPVPIADKEIMSALDQLNEARTGFQNWIADIGDAMNAIVKEATASGSRRRIIESGQLARQRFRAATQVEELDYRIRTQFPHPLAYVWREVQVSGPDRYHRLRALTKAAEAHTSFLAQLCIVFSKAISKPLSQVTAIASRLQSQKNGTSFGDWFGVIKEVAESRVFRRLEANAPLIELPLLTAENLWEPAIRTLMELRNNDSHYKLHPTSISEALLRDAQANLEVVFKSTEFLTDYRLLFITETKVDTIRRINRFQYLDLTGDNALAPRRIDESERNDLESGSLYLRDRQNRLHLLRPMLSYLECPQCHQMSTFFLDSCNQNEPEFVVIKSIERGSVRNEPIADDYRFLGLLK